MTEYSVATTKEITITIEIMISIVVVISTVIATAVYFWNAFSRTIGIIISMVVFFFNGGCNSGAKIVKYEQGRLYSKAD